MDIYLDACCLNRPFDDLSQRRVQLEAEAMLRIFELLSSAPDLVWVSSEVLRYEIDQAPDRERRENLRLLERAASRVVRLEEQIIVRGLELEMKGFAAYDALHLASAEHGMCDRFLTTDDRLLRLAMKDALDPAVTVMNPIDWLKGDGSQWTPRR